MVEMQYKDTLYKFTSIEEQITWMHSVRSNPLFDLPSVRSVLNKFPFMTQVVRHLTADGVWLHCKTYEAFLNATRGADRVYAVWVGSLYYDVTYLDLNKDLNGVRGTYRSGGTFLVCVTQPTLSEDNYGSLLYIECLKQVRLAREKYRCQVPNYRQILLGHMCSKLQMPG